MKFPSRSIVKKHRMLTILLLPFQTFFRTLKQKIRENHVKLVETLDTCLFEHLLPGYSRISFEEGGDRRTKVRALLQRLAHSPDDQSTEFAKVLAGLYPDIFEDIVGRRPSNFESSKPTCIYH